ncbi:Ppx/GppA family phosphatase [Pseudidiomarina sp. 1APP75-32.1]|uniref:Ppx/GppA family phosphatase n=1 Tax=Pseudidiomarina terrestris TaxID=2820060 RepID=A0AAW7R1G3_9GAMM|nr:Ppx/GppA family phosphatase [Pseudidiomarina sp. 1APP75-32.1]MDN7124953.1 Ppx/GppA family phosphatase [Pseudidiomarina sp. 1APP75-32.1]
MHPHPRIAAIDLGSNSFHMLIAKATTRGYRIITRHRQKVRLADGLTPDLTLDDAAIERGIECLKDFAQRLAHYQPLQIRCVATATLRKAHNRKQILKRFERALGSPIDIISGMTEAGLIYQGATLELARPDSAMLVLDIGGASTEVIAGVGTEPHVLKSLDMGCVVWQNRFFADGMISAARFAAAVAAAAEQIRPLATTYQAHGWQTVCGASGTFRGLQDCLRHYRADALSAEFIRFCMEESIKQGSVDALPAIGVREDRIAVFCGGLAILVALTENLGIQTVDLAQGALREGLVNTMLNERKRSLA